MTSATANNLLNSFKLHYAGGRTDYFGYKGECLSLAKRWYDWLKNDGVSVPQTAPGSGNNQGSGYYTIFPTALSAYFTKETYSPSKNYPAGSLIVYTYTSHIGILLDNQIASSNASVFEQNADPDGSPAGTHQRPKNHINGILVLKLTTSSSTSVVGKHINLPQDSGDWHLYHEDGPYSPRTGNWITVLHPSSTVGGYTYPIVGDKGNGIYVIDSPRWGRGALYTKGSKFTIK